MKKALVILLALTMVMSMLAVVPFGASAAEELAIGAVAADYKPEGTAVNTADDFAKMTADGKYYLAADITIDKTYEASFTGTFDGNGKTITTSVPVFAQFNGTAKNVTIAGSIKVEVAPANSGDFAGAFANVAGNAANATFTNMMNKAILASDVVGMGGIVGLVVGSNADNSVTFTDCANYGAISGNTGKGGTDCAGIAALYTSQNTTGEAKVEFTNCSNYADIKTSGRPAGIIGTAESSTIFTKCYNAGKITSLVNYCAGIVARIGFDDETAAEFVFDGCVNDADITFAGTNTAHVGGIVGLGTKCAEYTFKNCTNNGDITGEPAKVGLQVCMGGIIGNGSSETAELVTFENCVNNGDVITGTEKWDRDGWMTAGGIIGRQYLALNAVFKNCVNNGDISVVVTSTQGSKKNAAGMVGYTDCNLEFYNCINTGDITATYAAGIVAAAKGSKNWSTKDLVLSGCGNTGFISGGDSVGGLVGAAFCRDIRSIVITGCFNLGDCYNDGRSDIYVGGFVGWANMANGDAPGTVTIKYSYSGGQTDVKTTVIDVADVTGNFKEGKNYKFTHEGKDYYFNLYWDASAVIITGTKVTPTYLDHTMLAEGDTAEAGAYAVYYTDSGKLMALVTSTAGDVVIDGEKITINGVEQTAICVDPFVGTKPYLFNTALIGVYQSSAIAGWDISDNLILEGLGIPDYLIGRSMEYPSDYWRGAYVDAGERFTKEELQNGTVAAKLNALAGEDLFFQNLRADLFEVDAYPTTDKAHAKVVEGAVAGEYTNPIFNREDDTGSPETGDATIYVVVALAVSTVALAGFMVAKKVKEN